MPHVPDLSGSALDDRYELHAVIGEGAFGRVYEGRDRRLDRSIAVKVIKPWWADDPDWVADFERETRLLARISDPGIVQIYDVGNAPEGRYYVSELVRGENLAQRLRRGSMAPWQAAAIAAQLCRALAGAHAQRIVHRDVKPPNILLSNSGQVKVGDFGVAGLAEGSSGGGSHTIVGTPAYMAPEQSRGRPVSPATDVYSAGVVLYEMVAGALPFTAASPVDLALRHLQDPPPPLPASVPEPLQEIIVRALAKEPSQRYADGGEMSDALIHARRQAAERPRSKAERPRATAERFGARPPLRAPRRAAERSAANRAGERSAANRAGERSAGERSAANRGADGRGGRALMPVLAAAAALTPSTRPAGLPRRAGATPPPRRPAPPGAANGHRADDTRAGPLVSPRSEHNPPARRRAVAAVLAAFALVTAMVAAGILLDHGGTGSRPKHHGTALTTVPTVTGISANAAESKLRKAHLHVRTVSVPWPDHAPGIVRSQSSVAGRVARGSTVTLDVAEVPSWKTVGRFSSATSPVFLIQGSRFRLVYNAQNEKSCTLWVFCSRTSVKVTDAATRATIDSFDLSDGTGSSQMLDTGPGSYQVTVDPASGGARWSFAVQDWY
jgi:eukaryotic-like serine/threonine-protein kinase